MHKTLLAVALGLGFLFLDSHAKPSIAFLGLSRDSDPQISESISKQIQYELTADTGLAAIPSEDISMLYAKGILTKPEAGPLDMPRLAKGIGGRPGAEFYAFGSLQPISVTQKRTWWKPWAVVATWSQNLRLRVLSGTNGQTVYDAVVTGQIIEKGFITGPDGQLGRMAPLERDAWMRKMATAVSTESAKALSKVLKEQKPVAAEGAAPAAASDAAPAGG